MATYSKLPFSFAIGDRHIAVAATSAPGTPIHAGVAGTAAHDEVWMYCVNNYGSNISLNVWWGGTTASDLAIVPIANGAGRVLVADGVLINNNGTVGVSCVSTGTNGLVVDGYVHRIA